MIIHPFCLDVDQTLPGRWAGLCWDWASCRPSVWRWSSRQSSRHASDAELHTCKHTEIISLKSRSKALLIFELDVETREIILWLRLWNYCKMRWAQTSLLQQAHFSPHRRLHGNRFLSNNIQEALHEASWSAASPQWKPPKHTNSSTSEPSLTKTLQ